MLPFCKSYWGTPHSLHQKGQELFGPIDHATSQIYEAVGANFEDHFTFTASGAEAISQVFFSNYIDFTRESGRNHFLTLATEDSAILPSLQRLQDLDCAIKLLPVDVCGRLRPEVLEEAIKPRAALLSLSWANPLTGVIQPIADIASICHSKGIRLHVDASAVIGKLFFRFEEAGIDYLTFDGSLFHAPRGTGGLFCRKECPLRPLVAGPVNMNVGALAALGIAMQEAEANFDAMCTETARLRDKLESGILQVVPDARIFFQEAERLPNTSVIAFPGVHSEALLYALNRRGVYASTQKLSQVLRACSLDATLAASAVSFALSYKTQEAEIDRAVSIIAEAACQLREVTGELS
jgi:cysteine desulfurase